MLKAQRFLKQIWILHFTYLVALNNFTTELTRAARRITSENKDWPIFKKPSRDRFYDSE